MSEVRFDKQVVVVTGSARGMGRCHVLELGARGASVVVNDLPAEDGGPSGPAQAVAGEIAAAGGTAIVSCHDISGAAGCQALVQDAVDAFGRLDAIIHNAGIAFAVPVDELTEAEIEPTLRVHLHGAIQLTRAAWPHFKRQGGGRMLYITSGAGLYGVPGFAHYGPAKTGLLSLAKVVNLEGGEHGIRANALAVAAMTGMMEAMLSDAMFADRSVEADWWREHMRPEYTTPAALWLVHPDCPASGNTYQARAGRVARVVIAETRGYLHPGHTVEDVRDHFEQIEEPGDWVIIERSADLIGLEKRWLADLAADAAAG